MSRIGNRPGTATEKLGVKQEPFVDVPPDAGGRGVGDEPGCPAVSACSSSQAQAFSTPPAAISTPTADSVPFEAGCTRTRRQVAAERLVSFNTAPQAPRAPQQPSRAPPPLPTRQRSFRREEALSGKAPVCRTSSNEQPRPTSNYDASQCHSKLGQIHSRVSEGTQTQRRNTGISTVEGQGRAGGKGVPKRSSTHGGAHRCKNHGGTTLDMGIKNMEVVDEDTAMHTVEILKRPGQTLGFYIREGNNLDRYEGVFISRIAAGSVVESNGLLHVGDEIVAVNSVDVTRMSLDDVVILMSIPKRLVLTIRARRGCKNASCPSLSTLEPEEEPIPVVVLKKGRSSSATAVEMTEKCPDEFILAGREAGPSYAKSTSAGYSGQDPKRIRSSKSSSKHLVDRTLSGGGDDSGDSGLSSEASFTRSPHGDGHNAPPSYQHTAQSSISPRERQHLDDADHSIAYAHHDHRKLAPGSKMPGPTTRDGALPQQPFRSPLPPRRPMATYQVDYASDTETRPYPHDYQPRYTQRNYDPNVIRAFQEEIERTHPSYINTRQAYRLQAQTQSSTSRSISPDRYNSDSEIINTMYRGTTRERPPSACSSKDYLSQLMGVEDRCNSLPHMDSSQSSQELKHWLKKFDNLSFELQTADGVPGAAPIPPPPNSGNTGEGVYSEGTPGRESYTSEEYWTWAQRHSSPTSTIQRQPLPPPPPPPPLQQPLHIDTSPRPHMTSNRRPRMTRKLSADSLLDYRTYQMEDTVDSGVLRAGDLGRSIPAGPQRGSSVSSAPTTSMSRSRQSMDSSTLGTDKPTMTSSGSSSKLKDLQLARKPLQIRIDDYRLYQPDMEDRKARFDQCFDGLISVHIICGHGLKSSRTMLRDLYCVLEIDSVNKARTMIRTGAINFDWDEAFDVDIENAHEMSFLIYSWDPNTRHRLGFSSTLGLTAFLQYGNKQKIALKLEPKGILYLEIVYKEPGVTLQRTPSVRQSALFGVDLETVTRREKSSDNIPILVRRCIEEVEKRGLDHVGIYRLCGSARRKEQLKEDFEKNARTVDLSPEAVSDINVITGVLKDFLRELPEPLFTNALYSMLLDALSVRLPGDPTGSAKLMLSVLECLPKANQDTMAFLLDHLKRVAMKADINKMPNANLAVCFGPVLLCPSPQSALGMAEQAMDFKRHIEVLRYLLDIWPQARALKKRCNPSSQANTLPTARKQMIPPKAPNRPSNSNSQMRSRTLPRSVTINDSSDKVCLAAAAATPSRYPENHNPCCSTLYASSPQPPRRQPPRIQRSLSVDRDPRSADPTAAASKPGGNVSSAKCGCHCAQCLRVHGSRKPRMGGSAGYSMTRDASPSQPSNPIKK